MRGEEKGVALIELAICAPFLILFALYTYDLIRMIQVYGVVNHIVRNGVRFAATTDYLEQGDYHMWKVGSNWTSFGPGNPGPACPCPGQSSVLSRTRQILVEASNSGLPINGATAILHSTRSAVFPSTVKISVEMQYQGVVYPFNGIWLRSSETGGY